MLASVGKALTPITSQLLQPRAEKDLLLVTTRRALFANCLIQARKDIDHLEVEHTSAFVHRLDDKTIREVTFSEDQDGLIHTRLVSKLKPREQDCTR